MLMARSNAGLEEEQPRMVRTSWTTSATRARASWGYWMSPRFARWCLVFQYRRVLTSYRLAGTFSLSRQQPALTKNNNDDDDDDANLSCVVVARQPSPRCSKSYRVCATPRLVRRAFDRSRRRSPCSHLRPTSYLFRAWCRRRGCRRRARRPPLPARATASRPRHGGASGARAVTRAWWWRLRRRPTMATCCSGSECRTRCCISSRAASIARAPSERCWCAASTCASTPRARPSRRASCCRPSRCSRRKRTAPFCS